MQVDKSYRINDRAVSVRMKCTLNIFVKTKLLFDPIQSIGMRVHYGLADVFDTINIFIIAVVHKRKI